MNWSHEITRADLRVSGVLAKPALLTCSSDRDLWARCAVNSFNGIANFVAARWSALALYGLPLAPLECRLMAQAVWKGVGISAIVRATSVLRPI